MTTQRQRPTRNASAFAVSAALLVALVCVPAVNWDRTARDVLTLEWIDAIALSDRARIEAKGHDLKQLARAVIQTGEYDFGWNIQVEDDVLLRLEKGGKGKTVYAVGGDTARDELVTRAQRVYSYAVFAHAVDTTDQAAAARAGQARSLGARAGAVMGRAGVGPGRQHLEGVARHADRGGYRMRRRLNLQQAADPEPHQPDGEPGSRSSWVCHDLELTL